MSVTTVSSHSETHAPIAGKVDLKLEAVVIPVSDLDRAKKFYTGPGWRLDADFSKGNARVLQFTPPGSPCSSETSSASSGSPPTGGSRMGNTDGVKGFETRRLTPPPPPPVL